VSFPEGQLPSATTMKLSPSILASLATRATSHILPRQSPIDYDAAPPNLSTLSNSSLFTIWRPKAHVLPAYGQIGDPCMHYTSPSTGLFHVGYLHEGASGATTSNLITYSDLNPDSAPFIRAGGINDLIAVFDGSVIERGINETPTMLYTSVSYLPIQWTIPYTKGSETQSLAVERDGGSNFTKLQHGPVIPGAPFAVNVTGFRDPFVFQNAQVDRLLEKPNGTWYTIISGGVHSEGPCIFLYGQYESDPTFQTWEYLGQYWHEEANSTWSEENWAGRWGFNFEVGNFFALDERGANPEGEVFLTAGAEWSYEPIVPQVSDNRDMLWVAGKQTINDDGKLTFEPTMAGRLDAGRSTYAAAGKVLPANSIASRASGAPDRFISYLWLTGDFYGTQDFPTPQQNWTGSLLLPRELSVGYLHVVDNALSREKGAWRVDCEHENGTITLATLHQKIAREPYAAFQSNATNVITQTGGSLSETTRFDMSPESKHYVFTTSITFPSRSDDVKAGFEILSGAHESTRIYYQFPDESFIVDRSNSSAAAATTNGINTELETGKFRLFDMVGGNGTEIERLDLTIVVDGGVVEVHANNRFALSTWVRPWYFSSRNISFFASGGVVKFSDVVVYEGLVDAWPKRPS
jgi:beta-fructofuranosidase